MTATNHKHYVLIVDGHPAVREGLACRLVHEAFECAEAASAEEALAQMKGRVPDAVVLDMSLREGSVELIKRICVRFPQARVLAWAALDESMTAERALTAGALGSIDKSQSTDRVVEAIRSVIAGRLFVSGQAADRLLKHSLRTNTNQLQSLAEVLSQRELEVFRLIGMGLTTVEIAERMGVTRKTVDTFRSRVKDKLNIRNLAELVWLATRWNVDRE